MEKGKWKKKFKKLGYRRLKLQTEQTNAGNEMTKL